MATYRGSDGSLTVATNSVANLQSWEVNTSRPVLVKTAMGDTAPAKDLDVVDWKGRLTAHFDYSDTAQAALVDQAIAGTTASAVAGEFLVAATKKLTGNILAASASIRSRRGSLVELDIAFEGTGALAVSWS